MKNIKLSNLKKCLFKTIDEFQTDIKNAFNGKLKVSCDYDGISFDSVNENDTTEDNFDNSNIYTTLAAYYDIAEITSIHTDDCDYTGVWICYKEQEDTNTAKIIDEIEDILAKYDTDYIRIDMDYADDAMALAIYQSNGLPPVTKTLTNKDDINFKMLDIALEEINSRH